MSYFPRILQDRIALLDQTSTHRMLSCRSGIDFSSNDYLGFSSDPRLKSAFFDRLHQAQGYQKDSLYLGAAGSRLLRGQLEIFESTERALADFSGRESAVFFPSGYQANLGLLSAVLKPQDWVYSDQYNHASIIDGIRLSGAQKRIYPHMNVQALREILEADRTSGVGAGALKVIVTESIFSMDGDLAPLLQLAELAQEFFALFIVDEAHATGLWGETGGGWVQELGLRDRVFATIHPAGKALGVSGAWVAGDAPLKDYLVNYSRPFIYSTAPSPVLAILLRTAIEYWKEVGPYRAKIVLQRSIELQRSLSHVMQGKFKIPEVLGLILPLIIGENSEALAWARKLQTAGFDVRAIRPPTVPEGTSRLRLTVNWCQTEEELDRLVDFFVNLLMENQVKGGKNGIYQFKNV